MANQSVLELKNLAALYALGHLQGKQRSAFEALLQDPHSQAAVYLGQLQPVVEALARAITPKQPPPQLRSRLLERVRQEGHAAPPASRITLAPGLLLVLADKLAWKETAVPGIRYKTLFVDRQRRYATSLVAMAPGARYPRHRHTQTEELILLSGDVQIGNYPLQPGDYSRSETGTVHEPIWTKAGCTFIALAALDDELFPEMADENPPSPPIAPDQR